MQDEQPTIVLKHKNVRGVRLRSVHFVTDSRRDVLEARYPCRRALNFNRKFGDVDAHEICVAKDLFPACANVFPPCQTIPIRMDANRAGISGPDFIHQLDIEAFEREIELEIGLNHLLGIGHKE